jgi:hypothetical protein
MCCGSENSSKRQTHQYQNLIPRFGKDPEKSHQRKHSLPDLDFKYIAQARQWEIERSGLNAHDEGLVTLHMKLHFVCVCLCVSIEHSERMAKCPVMTI